MNKLKKIVCLLLVIAMIFPVFDGTITHAAINNPSVYDEMRDYFTSATKNNQTWESFKTYYGVPSDTPFKNTNGWFFNIELWHDLQIVAYGDHASIGNNDFKNATLKNYSGDLTVGHKNQGYYRSGSLKGEYRYHGFDASGNKYVNLDFPADADSGRKPESKKWIYKIWDLSSPYYRKSRIETASNYYDIASGTLSESDSVRQWIAETLPFKIVNSTNANKDAYNYAHVTTAPTTRFPGEALMYHDSNIIYYQTFSLNKRVQDKSKLEMAPFIAVERTGDSFDPVKKASLEYDVKLTGIYRDAELWSPYTTYGGMPVEVARTVFYTRDEIKSWTIKLRDSLTNDLVVAENVKNNGNRGSNTFKVSIPYEKYKNKLTSNPESDKRIDIAFNGEITVFFHNGDSITRTISSLDSAEAPNLEDLNENGNQETNPTLPYVEKITLEISAPRYMLDTEKFKINDATELPDDATRKVILEGDELSSADSENFIAGQHLFPLIGKDKIYTYSIIYTDGEGTNVTYSSYIVVYTTKPKAQFKTEGTFKENRKITVNTDFTSVNSSYLLSNATLSNISFDAASDYTGSVKFKTKNSNQMVFLVKNESELSINIRTQAVISPSLIERSDIPSGYFVSDDYNQSYRIDKDYAPAIIANIWSGVMIRGESLDFAYEGSSYDDDLISINTYKIYYDSNGDSIPELLVKQGNWDDYNGFVANSLGAYKIVFEVEESFGQETIEEFITPSDKRKATVERMFYVDNVAPVTAIETNINVNIPKVDLLVLNDEGITRELNEEIKNKRVDWINALGQSKGVSANVQIWDLYTYIDSKTVSPTRHTGSSYPSATWNYSSGGYSGILNRINVRDNGSYYDYGYYQEYTTTEQIPIWEGATDFDCILRGDCRRIVGYETVTTTHYEWVSNYVWESNYYGDYHGTITKPIKQTFDPTLNISSEKYIIYIAKDAIKNPADLDLMKKKASSKLILVGNPSLEGTISHYAFVNVNQPTDDIIKAVNTIIGNDNALSNKKLLLVGEAFQTYFMDYDEEKDSLVNSGLQYVHEQNFYDNSMGLETGAVSVYSSGSYVIQPTKTSFSKPGKYTVYRRVKDSIPGFTSYEKFSNDALMEIYVHRKPIADFNLDWDYDAATSTYITTWVDKSYDLDHQFSDPQRGIRDRKIMYRKTSGDNLWIYAIPQNLTSGTYELRYTVKDIEGVWSDEKVTTFTLAAEVPMQFSAELRSKIPEMLLSKFTIGNDVEWYDVWTRFPYAHRLEISLWDGATRVTTLPIKTVSYNGTNAIKSGNDYNWSNISYSIPKGIGLQEKTYTVRIEAISNLNAANKATINRSITLINNTAPTVSFTAQSPTTVYEGDTIRNTILPLDADGDRLTVQYYVAKPGESFVLFKTYSNVQQGVPFVLDDVINVDSGNYQFRVIVNDGNGGIGQAEKTISVNPFGISSVSITPSPLKAGYWIEMTITTFGKVTSVSAQYLNGKDANSVVVLVPQSSIANDTNTFKVKYQTWDNELDGVYQIRFTAVRESRNKSVIGNYEIKGSVLDQKAIIEKIGD